MSDKSWREAYAIRNKIIKQRGIAAEADSGAVANAASIANASFRDAIKQDNSVPLRPLTQPEPLAGVEEKRLKDDTYRETIEKGGFEGFMGAVGQAVDKPVIKQAIDAISTGMYSSANVINEGLKVTEDMTKRMKAGDNSFGDTVADMGKLLAATPVGIAKGIAGGLGGQAEYQFGQGKNIKKVQELSGIKELDGGATGAVQGWGGLAGDILLDPLTYATFGAVPLVKGAVRGAVQGSTKSKAAASAGLKDIEKAGGSVDSRLSKIANNPKGRVGTAVQEAKFDKRKWDAYRATTNADKKIIRALQKDPAADATGLSVGAKNYLKMMDENIVTRQADTAAETFAKADEESGLTQSDAAFNDALRQGDEIPTAPIAAIDEVIPEPLAPKADPNLEDLLNTPPPAIAVEDKIAATPLASGMEDTANAAPAAAPEIKASIADLTTVQGHVNAVKVAMGNGTKLTSRQISGTIANGSASRKVMDHVLSLTNTKREAGKELTAAQLKEVAAKFITLSRNTDKAISVEAKRIAEAAKRKPTRKEEILGRDGEKLEAAKANVADIVDEIASSPKAFTEEVQTVVRRNEFNTAVREAREVSANPKFEGVDFSDVGHRGAQAAVAKQTKEGKFKTDGKYSTDTNDSTLTGGAWKSEAWGTHSQIALHTSIIKEIADIPGIQNVPNLKRSAYVASLKVTDKELRAAGVQPFLGIPSEARNVNLSLYDVVATLNVHAQKTLTETLFSGASKGFQPTDYMEAARILVNGRVKNLPEEKIAEQLKKIFTDARVFKAGPEDTVATKIEAATTAMMNPKVYEELSIRSVINHAFHNSVLGKEVDDLAEGTIQGLREMAATSSVGAALKFITDRATEVIKTIPKGDLSKAKDAYTMKMATVIGEAEAAALIQVEKRVKEAFTVTPPAKAKEFIVDKAKIEANGKTNLENTKQLVTVSPEAAAARVTANSTAAKEVPDIQAEVAGAAAEARTAGQVIEEFDKVSAEIATNTLRKIHPIQALVNPRLGLTGDTYRAVNSGLHSIARQQNTFHSTLLSQLEKRGHAALQEDFTIIQRLSAEHLAKDGMDVPFKLPSDIAESTREMYEIMNVLFDTSMRNIYARNAIGADHFNAHMRAAGLNKEWEFLRGASQVENSQLWTQWKGIEKNGVMDFMSKIHSASVKASQDISIAASFSSNFGKKNYEKGLVKIVWTGKRDEAGLYDLIDRTLFYPKDVAEQLRGLDNLLTESRSLNASKPIAKWFVNVFDPVTNALKASQTTVRPGHWVINTAGDLLRNQLAGINNLTPYKHSYGIMRAAGLKPEDFMGEITSATATKLEKNLALYNKEGVSTPGFDLSAGDGKGVNVIIGGKKVKILYTDFAKLINDGVAIPPHRGGGGGAVEDRLMSEGAQSRFAKTLTKGVDAVTDNSAFSLNKTAAFRDNFSRIALAVDHASKRRWKSVDEMKAAMEEHVTKWAPLSTDFTAFEAKYARRTILYYTWLRGITPRVIDAAMTKPGVATMIPKAMYNAAYANGLHPESVGNPFPPDGMFPEYYSKNILGPQWEDDFGMWGINPSSPIIEVANTFAGLNPMHPGESALSIGKTLGGMATPFAKIPVELATQQSNNIPIENNTQYLLDSLSGSYGGALSRATGKTLSDDSLIPAIVDRSDSAAKGDSAAQAEHAKLQFLNFMTGAKLTDYQSTGAQKSAAYSLQQQAKERAEK